MKKLFTALMIAGLFGLASCGSNEQKTDESTGADTSMAPAENTAPAENVAPADTTAPADTMPK